MPVRGRAESGWRIAAVEVTTYDRRNRAVRRRLENPSWDQVRNAILSLDAGRQSDMVIEAADGSLLPIGGGCGRYHACIVYPKGSPRHSMMLADPSGGEAAKELIVGGVTTPLPGRLVVTE
jgi:hypothetical protein